MLVQQFNQMSVVAKRAVDKEARMSIFCVSSFRPGTQTAHMVSSGQQPNPKAYAQEVHFFSTNSPQQQLQLKTGLGVVPGKYDVPLMSLKAPLGTSVFQLLREQEFANQNRAFLNQKYADNLAKQSGKLTAQEKRPKYIEEPRPGAQHIVCAVCREQFKDYYEHIFSGRHRRAVGQWSSIFLEIDKAIKDVAAHQIEKRRKYLESILAQAHSSAALQQQQQVANPEEKHPLSTLIPQCAEDTSSGNAATQATLAPTKSSALSVMTIDLDGADSEAAPLLPPHLPTGGQSAVLGKRLAIKALESPGGPPAAGRRRELKQAARQHSDSSSL